MVHCQIPLFGPLFDGAIVDFASLPGLVRETAVNAGNMIRTQIPYYKTLYPSSALPRVGYRVVRIIDPPHLLVGCRNR